jgi:hypothetical protein
MSEEIKIKNKDKPSFIFFGIDGVDFRLVEKYDMWEWAPIRHSLDQDMQKYNKKAGLFSPFVWGSIFRGHWDHRFQGLTNDYSKEDALKDEEEYVWNDDGMKGAYINIVVCKGHLTWIDYRMTRIVDLRTSVMHLIELTGLLAQANVSFNHMYVVAQNADLFSHTVSHHNVEMADEYRNPPAHVRCPHCHKVFESPQVRTAMQQHGGLLKFKDQEIKDVKMQCVYTQIELWMWSVIKLLKPDYWLGVSDHGWDWTIKLNRDDAFGVANHSTHSTLVSNIEEFEDIKTMSSFIKKWRGIVKNTTSTLDEKEVYTTEEEKKLIEKFEEMGYVG